MSETATEHSPYEIIVNGRVRHVTRALVTFEEVIQLAFPNSPPGTIFDVTYQHAESKPHDGQLQPGESVEVRKRNTAFNVNRSVRS